MSLPGHERAHIWAVGSGTESPLSPLLRTRVKTLAQQLLADALEPSLTDDRFGSGFGDGESFRAALALSGDACVGLLSGSISDGRLQLAGLVCSSTGPLSAAELQSADSAQPETTSGPISGSGKDLATQRLQELFDVLEPDFVNASIDAVELWAHPETRWHRDLAVSNGFEPFRALHQLRCQLPILPDSTATKPQFSVTTRSFDASRDSNALIEINNRAFADHPDQGAMTADDLNETMQQSWFDPEGLRIFDDPDDPSVMAGFCWTKIHRGHGRQPDLGEIYVIGVDPRHHGKGLGRPVTAAGLDWLVSQGLTTGMLYVEATNEPALRTYRRLGFTTHRTDRAWIRHVAKTENV